eukprot:UN03435
MAIWKRKQTRRAMQKIGACSQPLWSHKAILCPRLLNMLIMLKMVKVLKAHPIGIHPQQWVIVASSWIPKLDNTVNMFCICFYCSIGISLFCLNPSLLSILSLRFVVHF